MPSDALQVVALKMEIDVERFERDPEGLHLASRINAHLPPEACTHALLVLCTSQWHRVSCRM